MTKVPDDDNSKLCIVGEISQVSGRELDSEDRSNVVVTSADSGSSVKLEQEIFLQLQQDDDDDDDGDDDDDDDNGHTGLQEQNDLAAVDHMKRQGFSPVENGRNKTTASRVESRDDPVFIQNLWHKLPRTIRTQIRHEIASAAEIGEADICNLGPREQLRHQSPAEGNSADNKAAENTDTFLLKV